MQNWILADLNPQVPKALILNTFFWGRLRGVQNDQYNFPMVCRWLSCNAAPGINHFVKVIIPIHSHFAHWCGMAINLQEYSIEWMDSFSVDISEVHHNACVAHCFLTDYFLLTTRKSLPPFEFWTVGIANFPKQTNCDDCGVFFLNGIKCITQAQPINFNQSDIPKLRRLMTLEILDLDPTRCIITSKNNTTFKNHNAASAAQGATGISCKHCLYRRLQRLWIFITKTWRQFSSHREVMVTAHLASW